MQGKASRYIIGRLKEPTTWAGIFAFLTGIGVTVAPELQGAVVTAGVGLSGAALIFLKEGKGGD